MADIARMTQTALKEASKGASKATSKDGALSDPKKLAVAGIGLAALPVAVEQVAKRVAPKVSDLGELWHEIGEAVAGVVDRWTLGDLVARAEERRRAARPMYHI